jgi:hypothetical protein
VEKVETTGQDQQTKILAYQQLGATVELAVHLARQDAKLEALREDCGPAIKLTDNLKWVGIAIALPFLGAMGTAMYAWFSR